MLANLMKNSQWQTKVYKAHEGFDDFSNILWPQRFSEAALRSKRQELIEAHDAAGYSAELLNDPLDNSEAYLRKEDFLPMNEVDYDRPKRIAAGWDFAVSKADLANRTSCTVGGKCSANLLYFLDFLVGRWSPSESREAIERGTLGWIDVMFQVEQRWHPEFHAVEGGVIWDAVKRVIYEEMQVRDVFLNIVVIKSIKDKATRGKSLQKRHRAGATRWNTQATGYEGAKDEMLRFTGGAAARLDDQFDSAAILSLAFDNAPLVEEDDFEPEEQIEMRRQNPRRNDGRSSVTGY